MIQSLYTCTLNQILSGVSEPDDAFVLGFVNHFRSTGNKYRAYLCKFFRAMFQHRSPARSWTLDGKKSALSSPIGTNQHSTDVDLPGYIFAICQVCRRDGD